MLRCRSLHVSLTQSLDPALANLCFDLDSALQEVVHDFLDYFRQQAPKVLSNNLQSRLPHCWNMSTSERAMLDSVLDDSVESGDSPSIAAAWQLQLFDRGVQLNSHKPSHRRSSITRQSIAIGFGARSTGWTDEHCSSFSAPPGRR